MSANGGQPPVTPPPGPPGLAILENERLRQLQALLMQGVGQPAQGGGPQQVPPQDLEQPAVALNVEALIGQLPPQPPPQYGELPGEGYLYAGAPEIRQAALVKTTPEFARDALLRSIEVAAMNSMLPFSEKTPSEWAKAALAFSQAYLLLDPSVDNQGVPVGAEAHAQGAAQAAAAQEQGTQARATNAHKAALDEAAEEGKAAIAGHVAAHGSGENWTLPLTKSGYPEPPRLKSDPNAAAEGIADKNDPKTEELRGARGDLPRPKPRVGQ